MPAAARWFLGRRLPGLPPFLGLARPAWPTSSLRPSVKPEATKGAAGTSALDASCRQQVEGFRTYMAGGQVGVAGELLEDHWLLPGSRSEQHRCSAAMQDAEFWKPSPTSCT